MKDDFTEKTGWHSGYLFKGIMVKHLGLLISRQFEILSLHPYVLWFVKWLYCYIIANIKVTFFGHPLTMHMLKK